MVEMFQQSRLFLASDSCPAVPQGSTQVVGAAVGSSGPCRVLAPFVVEGVLVGGGEEASGLVDSYWW